MKKIMIVDDSKFMRTMIKNILQNEEYVFCEANDGIEAIAMYPNEKPDVVLLDITMPHMSGIEVLKKLKEIDAEVKIVMCSAVGQESIIREAVIEGAIDFIVKPFKEDVLKRTVCAIVYADKGV